MPAKPSPQCSCTPPMEYPHPSNCHPATPPTVSPWPPTIDGINTAPTPHGSNSTGQPPSNRPSRSRTPAQAAADDTRSDDVVLISPPTHPPPPKQRPDRPPTPRDLASLSPLANFALQIHPYLADQPLKLAGFPHVALDCLFHGATYATACIRSSPHARHYIGDYPAGVIRPTPAVHFTYGD